ncbi:MAG: phosphoesterase [Acidimicrobiales bacterium]|nr:phosphoesterase [Acidimicrobiales bacterium]
MTTRPRSVGRVDRHRHTLPAPAAIALVAALAVLTAACSSGSTTSSSTTAASQPPPSGNASTTGLPGIHHVFVILLENEGFDATFGSPSADPYLATTLPASGALLTNYYGIGHFSNGNYIGLISGQAPNPLNQADCQVFGDFPATATVSPDGQISDSGCVFPPAVTTVANQLNQAHLTWKGYMEDMGNIPAREAAVCGHPAVETADRTQAAVPGDGYATRHNPFVYFHSIIDNPSLCDSTVVPLGTATGALPSGTPTGVTGLATDLKSASTTPNLSFVSPNLCNDGHDAPCVNQHASPSAFANIDTFLKTWVPLITGSPAFKKDGLLEVTFDESVTADATSCCNQTPGPAAASPGLSGPGGGRTGTVLISPFIKDGTTTDVPYNHYSTLATIEDLFGLTKLGQAKTTSATFGTDIFTRAG